MIKRLYIYDVEVNLTKDIDHEGYYADEVVYQIKSIPKREVLRMLITSNGGSTTHGDRIYRAIQEHSGETEAVVIGRAASLAASLLSAFDKVTIDPGAELMFHKAHIDGEDGDLTDEQVGIINRFNTKTYKRMKEKGVDAKFLSDVFLSEKIDNFWLTAEEAEDLGIGKVDNIDRTKYASNYAVAARLKEIKTKNQQKMDLFKKAVPRVVALSDGRHAIFESKDEELKVGNTLILAGSSEKLSGKINLANNIVAELDKTGKVVNMEEYEEPENDAMAEIEMIKADIEELKKAIMEIAGDGFEEDAEAMKKKEEEAEQKVTAANELLNKALKVANDLKTSFVPPRIENKNENINNDALNGLSESEKRAIEMKAVINAK